MTSELKSLSAPRKAVLGAAVLLVGTWLALNFARLTAAQNGATPLMLGLVFAALVIVRPKPESERLGLPAWALPAAAVGGAAAVVFGVLVPVHQFEWLGLLLVLYACLAWALPPRFGRDLAFGLFVLYWAHPLPGQLFGPLQLVLQRTSVVLSELLLHALNVRVWGDGQVLRTGMRVFGVPEECSGMKTAVTVLVCGLGVGTLFRLRWHETVGLMALGVLQVVVLNVLRISGIVKYGAGLPAEWADEFLHDTMGIFLLLGVVVIHLDAVIWRNVKAAHRRRRALEASGDDVGEPEDKARRLPVFWQYVFRWWWVPILVAGVGGGGFVGYRRSRPYHRAEMIRGVAEGLLLHDAENAERAARAGLALVPDDDTLRFDLASALFLRGQYEEVLQEVRRKPPGARTLQETITEARTLYELKRLDEAQRIIDALPADAKELPGVAMLLAEFAAAMDRPEDVSRHVRQASLGLGVEDRIRRLFPYMAARELWGAIREADRDIPYRDPSHGLIAATACLRMNDLAGAATVMRRALSSWEDEPLFLDPLLTLMLDRPGTGWERQFAAIFQANLLDLGAPELARCLGGCFAAHRPDLAWLAYRRLAAVAPGDPELHMTPAEYGDVWFTFRRQFLGLEAGRGTETISLAPFARLTRRLPGWRELWARVPLLDELADGMTEKERQRHLEQALAALQAAERAGPIERRLEALYPRVLGMLGRWDEAHAKLDEFGKRYPDRQPQLLLERASLFFQQRQWQSAYEVLAEYARTVPNPGTEPRVALANTLMQLNLGAYAMGVLEESRGVFPEADSIRTAMAAIWAYFGFAEESLFALREVRVPVDPRFRAWLLMRTGRVGAARRLAGAEQIEDLGQPPKQGELLPPAEWSLEWRSGALQDADYARGAAVAGAGTGAMQSPYVQGLSRLRVAWYEARGSGETSRADRWQAVGRDDSERAMALNELTVLLALQGRREEALAVAERSVALRPQWSVLWRLRAVLCGGRREVVEEAHRACPRDGEIWLQYLVVRGRAPEATAEWALGEVRRAISDSLYPVATLVRGGEYLLGRGFTEAAAEAAREAVRQGQGFLPPYVLGIRAALARRDRQAALECAVAGADQAAEPWPFYRAVVALKGMDGQTDGDMIRALEGLQQQFPDDRVWSERLGDVYFRRGELQQALGILEGVIRRNGVGEVRLGSVLKAAEAARLEGDVAKAVRLLEDAHARHPDRLAILNNLVYYLAQDPKTVPRARKLLPGLLEKGGESYSVQDTAAVVALKAGDTAQAEAHMKRALELVKQGDYAWHEVYLNAVEMDLQMGKLDAAQRGIERVRRDPSRSPATEMRVRDLQRELTRRQRERTASRWWE